METGNKREIVCKTLLYSLQSPSDVTTKDLARELAKNCRTLEDIQEVLKNVFKDTIQAILEKII